MFVYRNRINKGNPINEKEILFIGGFGYLAYEQDGFA